MGSSTTPASRQLLLIEDDAILRLLLAQHLRDIGCTVTEASTIHQARTALAERKYDIVVADVHLPDGDIFALARGIRAVNPTLPFIFTTGDVDDGVFKRALREHPAGYLLKPFELVELDALVLHNMETQGTHSRIQLETAAALRSSGAVRVMIRREPNVARPRSRSPLVVQVLVTVTLLMAAFAVGALLHSDAPPPPRQAELQRPVAERVIYVPVQTPIKGGVAPPSSQ